MTTVEIRSLRQLAKVLGVSQPLLSQVRAGKRPLPESMGKQVSALGAYHLLMGDKQSGSNLMGEHREISDTSDVAGAPGGIRTRDHLLRRQPLYPLSYWDTLSTYKEW